MSTQQSKQAPGEQRSAPRPSSSRTGWIIAAAVAAIVAVGAVIALSGGDDGKAVNGGEGTTAISTVDGASVPGDSIEEVRPVTIGGQPLAEKPQSGDDPAVGVAAPTIAGVNFAGQAVEIDTDKPVMYIFLAHWCPHCQKEVKVLSAWAAENGVPDNVQIVGVATSTDTSAPNYPPSTWLQSEGFPFPVIVDSGDFAAAKAFGLTGFPFFTLVDTDGVVRARASGEIEPEQLMEMVNGL